MDYMETLSSNPIISKESKENTSDNVLDSEFLNDMDSYLDDLSARLIVSRMVSDSTIKGIVGAVQEEATEKIASKELEIALLNEKLNRYRRLFGSNFDSHHDSRKELEYVKKLERLKIRLGDQLASTQLNNSASEQEWEEEVQKEICCIVVHDFVTSIQDAFEISISQPLSVPSTISSSWEFKMDEIFSIRGDLDNLYSSFSNSDSGLISHKSYETSKERNSVKMNVSENCASKMGDSDILVENFDSVGKNDDSPQLLSKTKDEIVTYFNSEINRVKRQYELALGEMTEELFTLKRNRMKEIGSSPFHFNKEKDFETIKKKISKLVCKLDNILKVSKKIGDPTYRMKEYIATLLKSQWLQNLMIDKKIDTEYKEIERLQSYIEELKTEATVKEEKYKSYLSNLISAAEYENEAVETMITMVDDSYMILFRGVIKDAISSVNPIVMDLINEKNSLNASFIESMNVMRLKREENERLTQEILSLRCQLEEKKEKLDLVHDELNHFRDRSSNQENLILNAKSELNRLKSEMDVAYQLINKQELELSNLKEKLMIASYDLKELGRENHMLECNNHAKQEKILEFMTRDKEQKEHLKTIIASTFELSKSIWDLECKFTQKLEENESRLNILNDCCIQLKHLSNLLKKKVACCKISYEAKCQDLQKAEIEVDMLGDEVETLCGLLKTIYIALDHYSHVLRHYPGVMETLKLIKREIDKESISSR